MLGFCLGPPPTLASSKLENLEREEFMHFSAERVVGVGPRPKDQRRGKDLGFGWCKVFDRLDRGRLVRSLVIILCCFVSSGPCK